MGYYMDGAGNTYYTDTPDANAQQATTPETYYDAWGNNVGSTISPWNSSEEQERRYQMAMNYTPEEYQAALAREATYLTPGGVGGFGGWMNQNLNAANLSQYVEPINKYVGPLVLPTVMAIGGGLVGGGLAGAALAGTALGSTAAGAITGAAQGLGASTFNTINQVDQGNTGGAILGALGSAATGGIAGAATGAATGAASTMGQDAINTLAGDAFAAPVLTVDPSLSLNTGLVTPDITSGFANYMGSTGADLASIYNTPSFTADPTLANNVTLPSLTPDVTAAPTYSNALTPTPEFQVNPALAPDAPAFSVNPSLDAFSNTLPELDPNYQSTAARDQILNDTTSKFAKGLLSGGNKANAALPTFQTNFTPLSSQAFGNTGNSWGVNKAGQSGLQGSTFKDAPFKGSYLMNGQDDQKLTSYLADYLPLNASKKMKDFSSFVA